MMKDTITLESLQKIMIDKGLAIRAIPMKTRTVVELRHKDQFPSGHAQYLEEFKREMWVEERDVRHGGQFVFESNCATKATIHFSGNKFYHSLEDLLEDLHA